MLTALLDALIDFIRVLVGWLVNVAVVLEGTPFSFAWPLLLALLLQLLLAGVSAVVWWARGAVWPINCGYPETTTGRGPCHNDVLGEWNRCRIHRRRGWMRRTDSHVIADLRRWQTISGGRVVERETQAAVAFCDSTPSGSACCTTAAGLDRPGMWPGFCPWSSGTTGTDSPSSGRRGGLRVGACAEAARPRSCLLTSSWLAS
jgi:hypothetical protein